ncbi:nuclear transport factor 2 family protein [Streptomyces sp. NPDC048434]|uniref:nuclear transport factor 2 family protein n=1 Tax=Streptomyces sp. NPDC048434 TaxID=3365549 RepID=UPI003723ED88
MTMHVPATDLTREDARTLFDRWTALWNGELALAAQILAPGFRIHFGGVPSADTDTDTDTDTDAFRGPDEFALFLAAFRDRFPAPGLRYAVDGTPVVESGTGYVVARWTVDVPDVEGAVVTRSGIDVLALGGGRVAEVWSITGARRFAP